MECLLVGRLLGFYFRAVFDVLEATSYGDSLARIGDAGISQCRLLESQLGRCQAKGWLGPFSRRRRIMPTVACGNLEEV